MTPTILIIDDSLSVHQLVSSCFVGQPWHVYSAYSGTEGLAAATSRVPEVVLLDVDLPDMNGFDVCRHLRLASARSTVIFLTASSSVDERACGSIVGAADYVTKPFNPAELADRIHRSLELREAPDRPADAAGRPPRREPARHGSDLDQPPRGRRSRTAAMHDRHRSHRRT